MVNLFNGYKPVSNINSVFKKRVLNLELPLIRRLKIASENIYERKWEVVGEVEDDSKWFKFSLASYNVLSQNLLENNKRLYKICQPRFLTWTHRKEALKNELNFYQPDIICMQEVHYKEFDGFFLPELQKLGYAGLYKKRTSGKEDGCATFFKNQKFTLEAFKELEYRRKEVAALDPDNVGLLILLKPKHHLCQRTSHIENPNVDNNLQTHEPTLSSDELDDLKFCVANTHLFFNPQRGDVKLAQMMTLMASIDDFNNNQISPTFLCGDFNAVPNSGLQNFMLNGSVECKDVDALYFSGQNKQTSENMSSAIRRRQLSPFFLQKMTSLTDQCQYVDVLKRRLEIKCSLQNPSISLYNLRNSYENEANKDMKSPFSYTQGSGSISHNFNFRPVYNYTNYNDYYPDIKEVSFFLETNCSNVDYIFYTKFNKKKAQNQKDESEVISTNRNDEIPSPSSSSSSTPSSPSLSHSPTSSFQKELRLLGRLQLLTESQTRCKYPTGMPNQLLASDHFLIMAEFGLKINF